MEYIQRIPCHGTGHAGLFGRLPRTETGNLTLGAAHMFSSYLLPHLIARFLHVYPDIHVSIAESDFVSLQGMTLNGDVDLLIESHDFDQELFQVYPLFEEYILLAVPTNDTVNSGKAACALTAADVLRNRHVDEQWPCHPFGTVS